MAREMRNLKKRIVEMQLHKIRAMVRARDIVGIKRWRENFHRYDQEGKATLDDATCITNLWRRSLESGTMTPKESTLMIVFWYLLVAEGGICNDLNYISYLLVTTGHDLYSLTKRKYVKADVEEIRKVEMSTKLQFLRHHGFAALTKEYDSTLRNDIAHHNYRVDEEGVLWVREEPVKLETKITPLGKIINLVVESTEEVNKKLERLLKKLEKKATKT